MADLCLSKLFNLLFPDSKLHLMERISISWRFYLHNLHSIEQNHSNRSSITPTIIQSSHSKLHTQSSNPSQLLIPFKLLNSWQSLIYLLCIVTINRFEFFVFTCLCVNQSRRLNGQILEISNSLLLNNCLRRERRSLFSRSCKINRLIVFDTFQFSLALILLQRHMMLPRNS